LSTLLQIQVIQVSTSGAFVNIIPPTSTASMKNFS